MKFSMRAFCWAVVLLCCVSGGGIAQQPAPKPSPEPPLAPSVDQMIDGLAATRAKLLELQKLEAQQVEAIKKRLAEINERLAGLGVVPVPPFPVPPGPAPKDEFQKDIRAIFDADATKDKREHALQLAALYRAAVKYCADSSVTDCLQLLGLIKEASKALVPDGAFVKVRERVADELGKIAEPEAPLTEPLRKQIASVFERAAGALEEAAK